jgi:hypothetical protein
MTVEQVFASANFHESCQKGVSKMLSGTESNWNDVKCLSIEFKAGRLLSASESAPLRELSTTSQKIEITYSVNTQTISKTTIDTALTTIDTTDATAFSQGFASSAVGYGTVDTSAGSITGTTASSATTLGTSGSWKLEFFTDALCSIALIDSDNSAITYKPVGTATASCGNHKLQAADKAYKVNGCSSNLPMSISVSSATTCSGTPAVNTAYFEGTCEMVAANIYKKFTCGTPSTTGGATAGASQKSIIGAFVAGAFGLLVFM